MRFVSLFFKSKLWLLYITFCLKMSIYSPLQVKHSRTSSLSSYEKDFSELIRLYTKNKKSVQKLISKDLENSSKNSSRSPNGSSSGTHEMCKNVHDIDDYEFSDDDGFLASPNEKELSVQYLEDDCDQVQEVDDLDGIQLILEYDLFDIFIY